jgi:hypothetical protein
MSDIELPFIFTFRKKNRLEGASSLICSFCTKSVYMRMVTFSTSAGLIDLESRIFFETTMDCGRIVMTWSWPCTTTVLYCRPVVSFTYYYNYLLFLLREALGEV